MGEITEIYLDHLDGCLAHLSRRIREKIPRKKRGAREARSPMVTFCRTTDQNLIRWMSEEPLLPKGDTRFALICYLMLHGYKILEFETLSKTLKNTLELIGFGILPSEIIAKRIGYRQSQTLADVLHGKHGASEKVLESLREIHRENKGHLEQKKKEAFELLRLSFLTSNQQNKPLLLPPTPEPDGKASVKSMLSIMQGLLGLMREGTFDNLSPEETSLIERGTSMILELSARFSALGSKIISKKDNWPLDKGYTATLGNEEKEER